MKFRVVDYYNQAYNLGEEIWEFNDEYTDYVVDISIDDCSLDMLYKLIEAGYFLETVTIEDVLFEWLEPDLIEIRARDDYEPLGRLELEEWF